MKIGSLVVCIKPFDSDFYLMLSEEMNVRLPELESIYEIEDIQRCSCGEHDNLLLAEIPLGYWPDEHFAELQGPGEGNLILEQANEEPIIQILEPEILNNAGINI